MPTPFVLAVGPLYIGVILNWGLCGALLIQSYIYMVWYHRKDRLLIRALVYTLLVVEIVQTCLMTHTGWEILAYNWGDPTVLLNVPWSSATTPIMCGAVSMFAQLYFCWRIWILGKNLFTRSAAILSASLAVMQCISAMTYGGKFLALNFSSAFFLTQEAHTIAICWLVPTVVCDVFIAGTMVYIFFVAKSTGIAQTQTLLNRLIINTIQSGVITAVFAAFHLYTFLAYPDTLINIPFIYILSKLYTNVLFANLNNRNRLNSSGEVVSQGITLPGDSHTMGFSSRTGSSQTGPSSFNARTPAHAIEMTTTTDEHRDEEFKTGGNYQGKIGGDL